MGILKRGRERGERRSSNCKSENRPFSCVSCVYIVIIVWISSRLDRRQLLSPHLARLKKEVITVFLLGPPAPSVTSPLPKPFLTLLGFTLIDVVMASGGLLLF
jgi:hypothetical protein